MVAEELNAEGLNTSLQEVGRHQEVYKDMWLHTDRSYGMTFCSTELPIREYRDRAGIVKEIHDYWQKARLRIQNNLK